MPNKVDYKEEQRMYKAMAEPKVDTERSRPASRRKMWRHKQVNRLMTKKGYRNGIKISKI